MDNFDKLVEIVAKLRGPNGCPWDKKQTHDSLLPFLFEETNEVADSIFDQDPDHLKEELGDILLHILLHSKIAEENKNFTITDVIEEIKQKLIRRHPHIFGNRTAETPEEVNTIWEEVKKEEKKDVIQKSILDKIPKHFTPLLKSYKLQKEVGKVGFDWKKEDFSSVLAKVEEELEEIKEALKRRDPEELEHEVGDLLFSTVNLARHLDINAEVALSKCNKRFSERFKLVEEQVKQTRKKFQDFSLKELDNFWTHAKKLLETMSPEEALRQISQKPENESVE